MLVYFEGICMMPNLDFIGGNFSNQFTYTLVLNHQINTKVSLLSNIQEITKVNAKSSMKAKYIHKTIREYIYANLPPPQLLVAHHFPGIT